MNQGWIKLHRKLLDSSVMGRSAYFHLWVTLLLMANHKETTFIFNDKEQTLLPGQVLTGLHKLRKITKIPKTTIERILRFLENGNMIGQHVTSKFRIITISKWQYYQIDGTENGNQTENKQESSEKQAVTYKNDKNVKNDKNYGGGFHSEQYSQRQIVERAMKKLVEEGVY